MDLVKHLNKDQIILDLKSQDKKSLIEELLDRLIERKVLRPENREELLAEIMDREGKGSTGIGYEIAIPHAKTDRVEEIAVVLGIHHQGIAFDSIDHKPVKIFVMTLSSRKITGPHLQFMAAICNFLKNESVRKSLLAAPSVDSVYQILQSR